MFTPTVIFTKWGFFLPKSSSTSKAPILRSFYCQFLPFCSLSTGLFSDSSPKPLPSVFISIIMNSTLFCITPMNIFHGFPADLHWPCYHSALGAELQDCKTFGLVPEGACEAGGDRGHDVHPTSPGREITPAPTDPTLPPCSCQVQFQQLFTPPKQKETPADLQELSVEISAFRPCSFWSFLPFFPADFPGNWNKVVFGVPPNPKQSVILESGVYLMNFGLHSPLVISTCGKTKEKIPEVIILLEVWVVCYRLSPLTPTLSLEAAGY